MVTALNTSSGKIFEQFNWFYTNFLQEISNASNEFLHDGLKYKLVSVSRNMNALFQDDSYFVTKIKVNKNDEIYLRCSDKAVNIILTKAFGKSPKPFQINQITELEAKLITGFNDFLYFNIQKYLNTKEIHPNKESEIIHLTFFVKNIKENCSGKIIISIPTFLVSPALVEKQGEKFNDEYFLNSLVEVKLKIGKTIFTVSDLKELDIEDIVVLEQSNIKNMYLYYNNYTKDFRITPNPSLIISVDNSEGEDMEESITSENLWDSIQVEMSAEFEKVKLPLGELKNIEQGLVVDVSSVYSNKITLKVEEKIIATGELVIVNDRYGVKIDKIYANKTKAEKPANEVPQETPQIDESDDFNNFEDTNTEVQTMETTDEDDDFDYSDFELDDEDI